MGSIIHQPEVVMLDPESLTNVPLSGEVFPQLTVPVTELPEDNLR